MQLDLTTNLVANEQRTYNAYIFNNQLYNNIMELLYNKIHTIYMIALARRLLITSGIYPATRCAHLLQRLQLIRIIYPAVALTGRISG